MACLTSIECANHGCLDPISNVCICVGGWTGKGDYSPDGVHCDINKDAITGLNITAIVINAICCFLIIIYIAKECYRKNSLYFLSFHAKALFPIFFLLHGFGDIIFNAMKLASNGERTIGYDTSVTIVAALVPVAFFTGLILYFRLIIGFLNGYARMMSSESCAKVKTRFATLSFFSWFIPPMSLAICLVQCIGLLYPNKEDEIGMLYNIGLGILCLSFGFVFVHSLGFLIGELGVHLKNGAAASSDIKTVFSRLKIAYFVGGMMFSSMCVMCLIFGSWRLLLHRSTYLVVLFQIMMSPTMTVLILTVSKISKPDTKVARPGKVDSELKRISKVSQKPTFLSTYSQKNSVHTRVPIHPTNVMDVSMHPTNGKEHASIVLRGEGKEDEKIEGKEDEGKVEGEEGEDVLNKKIRRSSDP